MKLFNVFDTCNNILYNYHIIMYPNTIFERKEIHQIRNKSGFVVKVDK